MSKIKLVAPPSKVKKDGSVLIYAMMHISYKSIMINTGIYVNLHKKEWDSKEQKVLGYSKQAKDKNLAIQKVVSRLNDIMIDFRLDGKELTAERLLKEYENPTDKVNFYKYATEQLAYRKAEGIALNTYNRHKYTLSQLNEFKPNLLVSEIDEKFLQEYMHWLRKTHSNTNSSVSMKVGLILSYLRLMLKHGLIKKIGIEKPKLKKTAEERVAMTEEELQIMWEYYNYGCKLKGRKEALRKFLFMCFTGMRISDLKVISMRNIHNNILVFIPVKTVNTSGAEVRIPMTKYIWDLILDGGERTGNLFDEFSHISSINSRIEEACEAIGIKKKLTCHCGRHTFATLWLQKTKDVAKLQKLLGHSKIEMTMKYVHVTEQSIIDEMAMFEKSFAF